MAWWELLIATLALYPSWVLPMTTLPLQYCQRFCAEIKTHTPSAVCSVFSDRVQVRFCYQGAETGRIVGCSHCCSSTVFDWQLDSALLLRSRLASCGNSNLPAQRACETGFNSIVLQIIRALDGELR